MMGCVYLVGAGPGDPGLITVRGLEILRSAEVVVFDALVNPELLCECPGAEKIDVGKRSANHKKTQEEINELLVDLGEAGRTVVRLKGGDPFLFGRGAEEAEALRKAGVPVHVVPGISSSIAVPELAGIPVTHREHASMVTVITGHEKENGGRVDWHMLAESRGTLVVLMGMENAGGISRSLIAGGMDGGTPVGIVVSGTTDGQRTAVTTLERMEAKIAEERLEPPGIIVIGDVVLARGILGDMS
jgi:uroporphyrin-III C-methyltransferase